MTEDSQVYVAGQNRFGQLGTGDKDNRYSPILIKVGVNSDSGRGERIKQIAAGGFYTMFLKDNGQVYATGDNTAGQLGTGETGTAYVYSPILIKVGSNTHKERVKQIAVGGKHTMFLM